MSKTVTVQGAIYFDTSHAADPYPVWGTPYKFFAGGVGDFGSNIVVMPHTLTFDLPDDFDPRDKEIKALEAAKTKLQAQFTASITEINARISKLQALEFSPEVA